MSESTVLDFPNPPAPSSSPSAPDQSQLQAVPQTPTSPTSSPHSAHFSVSPSSSSPYQPAAATAAAAAASTPNSDKPHSTMALTAPLHSLDTTLLHLHKCLKTPVGIDTVLQFLCYTSRLAASLLDPASPSPSLTSSLFFPPARPLLLLLRPLLSLKSSPSTTTTVVLTKTLPSARRTRIKAPLLAARLRALSSLLTDARTIFRLWALVGLYAAARGVVLRLITIMRARRAAPAPAPITTTGVNQQQQQQQRQGEGSKSPPTVDLPTVVQALKLALAIPLQALENGAYLSSRGVLGWSARRQGRAMVWSARLWAVMVGMEVGRLLRVGWGRRGMKSNQQEEKDWKGKGGRGKEMEEEEKKWRLQLAQNLAWMPLTLHWSLTGGGFLGEGMVGLLGCVPGVIQMRELWRATGGEAEGGGLS